MKYLIYVLLLGGCASKPSNEMEAMTHEVLKAKQGVDIQINPLPKKMMLP